MPWVDLAIGIHDTSGLQFIATIRSESVLDLTIHRRSTDAWQGDKQYDEQEPHVTNEQQI